MTTTGGWLSIVLLALPAVGALWLLLTPGDRGDRLARPLGAVVSGLTLIFAVAAAVVFDGSRSGSMQLEVDWRWIPALDVRFHLGMDGISLPLILLTALLTFLCLLYSTRILPKAGHARGLVGLMLLLEVGLLGTFLALDLIVFFLFFELVLIPMWFVIARWGDAHGTPTPTSAATTFLLYTLLGSAIMVLGFLVVHAHTGTFDMVELAQSRGAGMSRGVQLIAALAMSAGFAVKTPMWPLHTWLPDAHTAAPTVGSVILAGALLKMGTYGLVRIVLPIVPSGAEDLAPYLGALGVVGIVYGSLACLAQRDAKRLIAYSSVGHMGFVLLGIASLTPAGINGALFANIAHGLITGLLFFVIGGIKDRHGTSDLEGIGRSLYARAPHLGGLLAFGAVASLGLPGLAGFWGEALAMLGAFRPGFDLDRPLFLVLMSIAGAGAVLTAAYLLRLVRRINQGPAPVARKRVVQQPTFGFADVSTIEFLAWAPAVALIVLIGFWPAVLLEVTNPAVIAVLGAGAGS
jgi:NADH-quinone oxidoreductase subunit M